MLLINTLTLTVDIFHVEILRSRSNQGHPRSKVPSKMHGRFILRAFDNLKHKIYLLRTIFANHPSNKLIFCNPLKISVICAESLQ